METREPVVTHISDTARWVAMLRARESKRADAIFRDPLAERLAGERGQKIDAELSRQHRNDWAIVVRTRLIDELVATSLAEGADRVINLAAGLDTRPYRLALPETLTWVEADLPGFVDEKERLLAGETPRCRVVREKVDLTDPVARAAFLDRALDGARRALVITEGLLVYLEPDQVREIARDLAGRSAIGWWMIDLASPGVMRMVRKRIAARLGDEAQLKFAPADGVAFFRPLGWRPREIRSYFREALRLRRGPRLFRLFAFFPDPDPERPGQRPWGAIIRFERNG
jgi:methyltransferase (TIGR00027 family)